MNKTPVILAVSILAITVFLEFYFIQYELFALFPHIGIFLHLIGGMCIAVGMFYFYYADTKPLNWFMQLFFIMGNVSMAAMGWEGFEWILSQFSNNSYQGSVNNTMADMYLGIAGGLLASTGIILTESRKK
ncbi:MAG: hypothetical protein H7259_01970 [Cytophagales bacterium]|nr:hypothetical protein [Cytophaga sp.]